jgi:hypothetical protein
LFAASPHSSKKPTSLPTLDAQASFTAMLDSFGPPADPVLQQPDPPPFIIEGPNGTLSFAEVVLTPLSPTPSEGNLAATEAASAEQASVAAAEAAHESPTAPTLPESSSAAGGSGVRTMAVPYVVGPHDTFASIGLRHRMSPEELLRLNGLRNPRARVGDVLLVWSERSDAEQSEDMQKMLVRQFRRRTGCTAAEAVYYLEMHDYQIGDAIRERQHDASWEAERAILVQLIQDEEAAKAEAEAAAAMAEAEALAEALERLSRANARVEASRALASCLGSSDAPRCLACLS